MMVQEDLASYKLSQLRHCLSAGEPLNPEVIDEWRDATGLEIREGYGQSETVSIQLDNLRLMYRVIQNIFIFACVSKEVVYSAQEYIINV